MVMMVVVMSRRLVLVFAVFDETRVFPEAFVNALELRLDVAQQGTLLGVARPAVLHHRPALGVEDGQSLGTDACEHMSIIIRPIAYL